MRGFGNLMHTRIFIIAFSYNQPMAVQCIAHKKDLDGLGSHAIVRRFAGETGEEITHYFADYDDLAEIIVKLSEEAEGEKVIIADLGYNSGVLSAKDALAKLCTANEVIWIDHHDWDGGEEILRLKLRFIHSTQLCAAELVQREFMPHDEVSQEIARLAHAHDFREESELAWKLYDVISSGYDKLSFVEALSRGEFWNEEFDEAYNKYQLAKEKGYAYLEEHLEVFEVNGYTCAMALSKKYLSSTLASLYLQRKGTDFVIVVYPDGKLSFRRNNPKINLRKIAQIFGGGGREVAAGAKIDKAVTEENYSQVFREIVEKIEESAEKVLR
jgi:oligoribonuclease NrnB/cAMP/cGMP phosphodiesterase (DHH superfamily)